MTLLASLVSASQRVGATSSRLGKVRELAALLQSLPAAEIDVAVHYLSGDTPQGRIGIGYSVLQAAAVKSGAGEPVLSIADVDREPTDIASVRCLRAQRQPNRSS
jgi:DNA ligase 1